MWHWKQDKVSSRKQIQIKGVKDNILLLPNNEYRVVLETSSVSFELKSEAEQDVLIDSFENFLNSLNTKLQILIRVREVNVETYVKDILKLKDKEKEKDLCKEWGISKMEFRRYKQLMKEKSK